MVEALSTRAFLDRVESEWSPALNNASLAAEVIAGPAFDAQQVTNALTGLARIAESWDPEDLARWPATVVVAMTYKALEDYQGGAFWERFSESFVERQRGRWTASDNSLWGDAYLLSLGDLGLPTFQTTRKYVGNMVIHAGIPTYCYTDFLRVLTRAVNQVGYEGPAAVAWLRSRIGTSTYANIDTPVQDFIETGDIYAADFVSRNVELLDRLQHGEDIDAVGLSDKYLALAKDFLEGPGAVVAGPRGAQNQLRPSLQLDPTSDRLFVNLPPVPEAQGMRWLVSADGELFDVKPPTDWASTHGAAAMPWDVPVPTRRLTIVSSHDSSINFNISLISERFPYLLFNEDGTHISPDAPVPAELVWLLRLDDGNPLKSDGTISEVARGSFPLGWSDWRLDLVDLSRASSFVVGESTRRQVSTKSRAQIVCAAPVPETTSAGMPVYSERPSVVLPSDVSTSAWTVSVKDLRTGSFLPTPTDASEPLAGLPSGTAGSFEIAVRGPLGRGARRRISLVDGLSVKTTSAFRPLSQEGLDVCVVQGSTDAPGLELSATTVTLGPTELSATILVTSGAVETSITVTPAAMAISVEGPGQSPRWEYTPLNLTTDTFVDSRILLRLPENAKGVVGLQMKRMNTTHQVIDSARLGDLTTAIYPLDKAADTANQLGAGDLTVKIPGREVLIARFQAATLASGATLNGNTVVLDGLVATEVEAVAWALYAPWLGPTVRPLTGDTWTIPDGLLGHGPIVFNLRVLDPWKEQQAPTQPETRNLFLVEPPTDSRADDLTQFLSGFDTRRRADFAPSKVMAQLAFGSPFSAPKACQLAPWQVEDLCQCVSADQKLAAISSLDVPREQRVHLAVLSGCAAEGFTPIGHPDDLTLASDLAFNPLETSLRSLTLLANVRAPIELSEFWIQTVEQLGSSVGFILCGVEDSAKKQPTFDTNAAMLLSMPQATRDGIIAASKYLPKSTTDSDSRATAAWQLFSALEDERIVDVAATALTIIAGATHLLRSSGFTREADAIRAREDPAAERKWMAIPAASIALALCARFGAHGHKDLQDFAKSRLQQWSALSAIAGKLCEIDLVLAEAYASSASTTDHPTIAAIPVGSSQTEDGE